MSKEELRQQMRQRKRQFTPQDLEELSFPIVARLKARLKEIRTIVAYYPLPDEVNICQLLDDLVAEGKRVYLPKVTGDITMELRRYTGSKDLKTGAFHIMEPVGPLLTSEECPEIMLVPGVAFDSLGHRLGRGRGYYDRFLCSFISYLPSLTTIGVCFDFQKVQEVPVDEHDIPVDEVI